jgi:REP element-mobilizing transposase RayT
MSQVPFVLDAYSRAIVLATLHEVCSHRGWMLLAAHVRRSHVHAIVESNVSPEAIMNAFKSYASRNLNQAGPKGLKRWARHGSTRWLWTDDEVTRAIKYIIDEQGSPMAAYFAGTQ